MTLHVRLMPLPDFSEDPNHSTMGEMVNCQNYSKQDKPTKDKNHDSVSRIMEDHKGTDIVSRKLKCTNPRCSAKTPC